MENLLNNIPPYILVPTMVVLTIIILFITFKALREGREVSFWPPKIGPRIKQDESSKESIHQVLSNTAQVVLAAHSKIEGEDEKQVTGKKIHRLERISVGDYRDIVFDDLKIRLKVKGITKENARRIQGFQEEEVNAVRIAVDWPFVKLDSLHAGEQVKSPAVYEFILPDVDVSINDKSIYSFKVSRYGTYIFITYVEHINPQTGEIDFNIEYVEVK